MCLVLPFMLAMNKIRDILTYAEFCSCGVVCSRNVRDGIQGKLGVEFCLNRSHSIKWKPKTSAV